MTGKPALASRQITVPCDLRVLFPEQRHSFLIDKIAVVVCSRGKMWRLPNTTEGWHSMKLRKFSLLFVITIAALAANGPSSRCIQGLPS